MLSGYPFQNLPPGFCRAFTIMAEGMAKAINPDYKLTVTQMMTKGYPVCEWVVERGWRIDPFPCCVHGI